jgi:hypothetical protein
VNVWEYTKYRGIHGNTGEYRGLQGNIGGYRIMKCCKQSTLYLYGKGNTWEYI